MGTDETLRQMTIEVWSDVMCPFCYLGHAALHEAIKAHEYGDSVNVVYRSFELSPDLAPGAMVNAEEALSAKSSFSVDQARLMNQRITERGASHGLEYRFDRVIMTNTRDAHRLSHLALREGLQEEMMQRLFEAHFRDGLHIGDHEVLADLAVEVGLDRDAVIDSLHSGEFDDAVQADEDRARAIGVSGVPYFVIDSQYALSGAQSVETFLRAMDTAWSGNGVK